VNTFLENVQDERALTRLRGNECEIGILELPGMMLASTTRSNFARLSAVLVLTTWFTYHCPSSQRLDHIFNLAVEFVR